MKKLIAIALVLAIAVPSMAGTLAFQVAADDVKAAYEGTDVITIEVVGSGFGSLPFDEGSNIGGLTIDQILANAGSASAPAWNSVMTTAITINPVGDLVNAGGVLISGAQAGGSNADAPSNGVALYTFEFSFDGYNGTDPVVISAAGVALMDSWGSPNGVTSIDSLSLNAVPEPMTMALMGLGGLFLRRRRA